MSLKHYVTLILITNSNLHLALSHLPSYKKETTTRISILFINQQLNLSLACTIKVRVLGRVLKPSPHKLERNQDKRNRKIQ